MFYWCVLIGLAEIRSKHGDAQFKRFCRDTYHDRISSSTQKIFSIQFNQNTKLKSKSIWNNRRHRCASWCTSQLVLVNKERFGWIFFFLKKKQNIDGAIGRGMASIYMSLAVSSKMMEALAFEDIDFGYCVIILLLFVVGVFTDTHY